MRSAVRTVITVLVSALLLLTPFDCFATTGFDRAAADCCAKGKCLPTKNADSCCKQISPNSRNFIAGSGKVLLHFPAPVATAAIDQLVAIGPRFGLLRTFDSNVSPPGSPPGARFNLPLLI